MQQIARRLALRKDDLDRLLVIRIRTEVPEYRRAAVVPEEDLAASCADNTELILSSLVGEDDPGVASAIRTGRRRAEQGLSHAALLSAFRLGVQLVWDQLVALAAPEERDALLRDGATLWAVSDRFATAASDAHAGEIAAQVRRESSRRSAIVASLLDGGAAFSVETPAVEALGLRGSTFVVVAVEARDGALAIVRDLERALNAGANISSSWRHVPTGAEGLLALSRGTGMHCLLAILRSEDRAAIGVSGPFPRLSEAAGAAREARLALGTCSPGSSEARVYTENLLPAALVSSPREAEAVAALLDPLTDDLSGSAVQSMTVLKAWSRSGGDISALANELSMHRNTVRSHLERVERATGLDVRVPADAAVAYMAIEALRIDPARGRGAEGTP